MGVSGAILLWVIAAAPVHAQLARSVLPLGGTRPWAAGVSEAEQAIAVDLYTAGNRDFAESRIAQSLAKYKEALRHWDHPAIRYNMAVCFIHLNEPLEARDNLERSIEHGAAALGDEAYAQALTYRKLLDAQLARVKVACREPGAAVTLDGQLLFAAPGDADRTLLPGPHQLVVSKPGFATVSKALTLIAGERTTYDLPPLEPMTELVRRWAVWKPWAVIGGGAVAAAIGALSYRAAASHYAEYDRGIADHCPPPDGCTAEMVAAIPKLGRMRDLADRERLAASSLFVAGGAAVLVGVVGLIVNQPRLIRIPPPVVTPTPGGAAVSLCWGW